ncbi:MAG: glutamate synthase subunit beta [Lachnospiraceae bacterium]|nr:glutamate synthase subunit beta [Lachnospiraceae bacterium]
MGKATGFMDYKRKNSTEIPPLERIKNFNEFHEPLPMEEQQKQAARCMDCGVPFCQYGKIIGTMPSGCPLNNLVPEWNDNVYTGNLKMAYSRLSKTNNFPEFTSRVCPALCEAACTCNINGLPVTVKENERSIIENAYEKGLVSDEPPKVRTGKKVAVIGSGPSGLAAADQLNMRGHSVTVYERSDRVGGLLMYGIPNMKLEKHIIDRKVEYLKRKGIEFVTSTEVGTGKACQIPMVADGDEMSAYLGDMKVKNIKANKILDEYDAVVLACGASNPRDIKAEGRDAKGIYFAVDYLKTTTRSLLNSEFSDGKYVNADGKKVLVIGGGDTGNDCVGTAIRQGATGVVQLEMMPKLPEERADNNPWPEWPRVLKTDYGQQEAIAVFGHDPRIYETTVKEFVKDAEGHVCAAKCVKLAWEKDEETGRMNMREIEGSEYTIECDIVLIAAGFLGAQASVAESFGVELNARTNVATEEGAFKTNVEKVYACGDMRRGQSLVVWAIREGRDAASEVDAYLNGYKVI